MSKFKVGDRVRLSAFESRIGCAFLEKMMPEVGTNGFVESVLHIDGIGQVYGVNNFTWPESALTLVGEPAKTEPFPDPKHPFYVRCYNSLEYKALTDYMRNEKGWRPLDWINGKFLHDFPIIEFKNNWDELPEKRVPTGLMSLPFSVFADILGIAPAVLSPIIVTLENGEAEATVYHNEVIASYGPDKQQHVCISASEMESIIAAWNSMAEARKEVEK